MPDCMKGQSILITGGASGLGLAVAQRMLAEGAHVTIFDRSVQALEASREFLGDKVLTVRGDVTCHVDCQSAVAAALERCSKLDCVISNAGIWDYNRALAEFDPAEVQEAFHELFEVNVLGAINIARAALPALVESRGSVIATLSNAAFYAGGGGVLYTATKHALVGVVRQLAYEFAPWVRVNGVSPGAIATTLKGPAAMGLENADFPASAFSEMAQQILPIAELPRPEDYAGSYVFLACRADNMPLTGTVIHADGGFSAAGIAQARGGDDLPLQLAQGGN